ncbi:hypothetical protein [Kitasatospora sp. NPDC101183]|uniref:hypothetical protein n=1 Tax=Kitasatospora sp. NPDC101183 TaxID=3364100 RepID=UPI0037FFD8B3
MGTSGKPVRRRRTVRTTLAALGVAVSSIAVAIGAPATSASAQAHSCAADDGGRLLLGTPVNIWDRKLWGGLPIGDTSLGVLYMGYIPSCRQVYAEIHLNGNGGLIAGGTIYLADERHNSTGRLTFGPVVGYQFVTSGIVSIDVPEYDQGSTYAYPMAFRAALSFTEYNGCSTILTSGTHEFSTGANHDDGNGATCDH